MVRMERFTKKIALVVLVASAGLGVIELARGAALHEVFLMAVALAVSAIPEGLPIAPTVALSLGARRMAARRVIARRLVSVEALGSCTFIASDKTGTLTKNELTVRSVTFADGDVVEFNDDVTVDDDPRWHRLATAIALDNEASLSADASTGTGDAVDVAMLVFAHRLGVDRVQALHAWPRRCALAFEAERQYAASIHVVAADADRAPVAFVKGAPERVVQMCATAACREGDLAIDRAAALAVAHRLAERGARVLAVAAGPVEAGVVAGDVVDPAGLVGLTLLGFVGMIDPLRPEAKEAVAACRRAGIEVAMVTGDHPVTALAVAREVGIAAPHDTVDDVVTGAMLRAAVADDGGASTRHLDELVKGRAVFARIEPEQKLAIVESLQRAGHFVAVTGDGANDAPALRAAHIGVAMGARGTDVAKETAGLIVTDDNFASIVAGVEEGRVAYDNVRKVIFLAISTGAAEIMLFALAVVFSTPLPLLPIQLLWMNLVTNGIQDVGLAFEPRERDVLKDPPRRTDEAIFDRVMIQRVLVSATIMCAVSFAWFKILLDRGVPLELARNQMLLLMVLFENIHAGNCRSEHRSLLTHSPLRNPVLFVGTAFVQGLHLVAMHVPILADTLGLAPVSLQDWLTCLGLSLTLLVAMELEKLWRRARSSART
jgi:calcium-translocating P-type ATPase